MSEGGVFAVDRGIWSDPDFPPEPFTEREAWMWLVSAAAWRDIRICRNGVVISLERGEFCFSLRFLAEKFQWQKDRVDRFLKRLKKRDTICDTDRDSLKVYKIKNYNRFQRIGLPDRDTDEPEVETGPRQDRDKEETLKHYKKVPFSKENGKGAQLTLVPTPESPPSPTKPAKSAKPEKSLDPWKPVYDRGKEILGQWAGGQITVLRKLYDQKPHKVLAKLEDAAMQREPARWIAAFLWSCEDRGKLAGMSIPGPSPP